SFDVNEVIGLSSPTRGFRFLILLTFDERRCSSWNHFVSMHGLWAEKVNCKRQGSLGAGEILQYEPKVKVGISRSIKKWFPNFFPRSPRPVRRKHLSSLTCLPRSLTPTRIADPYDRAAQILHSITPDLSELR
ncbi:hypothetical protein T265_13066, partial [Opisthorchis viverrini]